MSEIRTPFETFRDTDGTPLDGGYVYIGIENQEPITHPASVFWDAALTIAAAQPIRTIGGYPVRAGAPAQVYVAGNYSITVKNSRGELVATLLSSGTLEALLAAVGGAGLVGYDDDEVYPDGTVGHAISSIPSAYVTYAADQAQTYRAFAAAGTAPAFTLTPSPAVSALAEPMGFEVTFAANGTTGSNTLNVSGLGAVALKQYDSAGSLVDGVIKSGQIAKVHYNGTYWVILDPLPSTGGGGDGYSDFTASCTGASAAVTMTAARVTVRNAAGASVELSDVAETITMTNTGAGGMDAAESLAASTWYYTYFIYNPTTGDVAALASLSANSPTLPTGYTYFRRMGALRTDATANKYPLRMAWSDDSAEYRPYNTGSNLTDWPTIQTGALGTVGGTPTFSAVAVTSFFPPTASRIRFLHGNEYGQSGSDQIGIESGTDGSYVLSCAEGGGGKRLVEINYIASIGVAAQSGTEVMAVGWVDHGGPIYVEE